MARLFVTMVMAKAVNRESLGIQVRGRDMYERYMHREKANIAMKTYTLKQRILIANL